MTSGKRLSFALTLVETEREACERTWNALYKQWQNMKHGQERDDLGITIDILDLIIKGKATVPSIKGSCVNLGYGEPLPGVAYPDIEPAADPWNVGGPQ